VSKDVIVTTPEEIARRGDLVGAVLRPALCDGNVIYERARAPHRGSGGCARRPTSPAAIVLAFC